MIDANSQFFAVLTNVGMAKQANADALGIPWKITDMGVGDANNTDPIPSSTQTRLINEWRRRPLNQLKVDPVNPAVIIAEQVIPADEGGRWIREIALYDADGDMVAVANCAPSYKPVLSQGSGRTQVVRMNFVVSSTASITLKIDPAVVLATRDYVDSRLLEELYKLDNKQSVRVATTANTALAGLLTIDGIVLAAGDRVLVKNQTVAKDNGLYIAAAGVWKRSEDADTNAEVTSALLVSVEQGNTLADTRWQLVTDGALVLGATALTFQNVTQGFAVINSPAFTGTPTAPTAPPGTNNTQLATTAFTQAALAALVNASPATLDTLNELAAAIGNDPNFATTMLNALALKAPKLNPSFSGQVDVPTALPGTNSTQAASTGFVEAVRLVLAAAIALKAPLVNPSFSGQVDVPTAPPGTNSTQAASTGFVEAVRVVLAAADALKAPLASPSLTGTPTGPTAAPGTNNTQLATTAFTQAALAALVNASPAALDTLNELAAAIGNDPSFATTMLNALTLKAPLASPTFTGNPKAPTPSQFDSSNSVANMAALTARGNQFSGFTAYTGALVGVVGHVGGVVYCSGAGPASYSLPGTVANSIPTGATVRIVNWSIAALTLSVQGTDKMNENLSVAASATNRLIPPDTYVDATYIGSGIWLLLGTGVMGKTAQFGSLLVANGYRKLPSGETEQWGSFLTTVFNGGFNYFSFPIGFNYDVISFVCSSSAGPTGYVGGEPVNLNSGRITSSSTTAQSVYWRAIGK